MLLYILGKVFPSLGAPFGAAEKPRKIQWEVQVCVYEIYCEGELRTKGESRHCFLDKEMKPVRMKRQFPEIYQRMKELVITATDK